MPTLVFIKSSESHCPHLSITPRLIPNGRAQASCPWPTPDRARTALSSSSAPSRPRGSMVRAPLSGVFPALLAGKDVAVTHRCPCHAGKHVVFGSVTKGMDVVKKVCSLGHASSMSLLHLHMRRDTHTCSSVNDASWSTSQQVEGYGSSSGKTSKKIMVDDCGQLS